MHAVMHIALERIQCRKDEAEAAALAHAERLRRGGLLVAFFRVVWRDGIAVVAVHHRGRRRRPLLSRAMALQVQQSKTPHLIAEVA